MTKCVITEMKEEYISAEPFINIIFMEIKMEFRYQNCQGCNLTLVFKDKSIIYFHLHFGYNINESFDKVFSPFLLSTSSADIS